MASRGGTLPLDNIARYAELHPKAPHLQFQYGTAGFRTLGVVLDSVLFRVGILAALRSKRLDGRTIGVMITASHNPEEDNGVKLVDPRGEMLEAAWESHATWLANASNEEFLDVLTEFVNVARIDLSKPARVVYARDTRPTGPALAKALEDGLAAIGAEGRNAGVTTTPILHYLVRAINTKGTKEAYGEDSEDGYFQKMSEAFRKLVSGRPRIPPLVVDCANGVGAPIAKQLTEYLGETMPMILHNTAIDTAGALNHNCGADFVKTKQTIPPSLQGVLRPGQRACSLDGDADRLMYYFIDERGYFVMLDGDKIAALVAAFIVDLVKLAGLADKIKVGVVQTAYANGASTKYLSERLPVRCVPTGVKHLHHAAEQFDVGVYFEANGHGTVIFSPNTLEKLETYEPSTPAQSTALKHLNNLVELINQTVGDALSDMLLVEVVLAHKSYNAEEWNSLYSDLPNRLVKVRVPNRNLFKTEDAERRLVSPPGLQPKIDELSRRYDGGRSFVRPSGTEDVVRVYAEAVLRSQADELAFRVAGLVYDEAGGDPNKRPKEFL
ncbi:phosphoacetylglucosamine mutase [Coprinopsis cinerea okayama7|uniref:Phosphoacetylglucosamine mutase n=1 Tax=Coprinopsis cinerea (strain Okayama-7 / 130 / ATCC MYA-4618 / FGSC 9003) TaxID=240176 RepID=D6RK39_COPC7|nr:phosphoacetylglucosamine mutase [Coprinopsis cinerea okayama7\|eukprot:XP_002912105.1 phosphoacetylglucosamine mutase [Coprinopsis cinerea okayama7\